MMALSSSGAAADGTPGTAGATGSADGGAGDDDRIQVKAAFGDQSEQRGDGGAGPTLLRVLPRGPGGLDPSYLVFALGGALALLLFVREYRAGR